MMWSNLPQRKKVKLRQTQPIIDMSEQIINIARKGNKNKCPKAP